MSFKPNYLKRLFAGLNEVAAIDARIEQLARASIPKNETVTKRVSVGRITTGHGSSELGFVVTLNDSWDRNAKPDFVALREGDELMVTIKRIN